MDRRWHPICCEHRYCSLAYLGITHFPSPEDFPIMPAEPITLLLRPRHFFECNPVMDVPPSFSITPSQVAAKGEGALDATDRISKLAVGGCRL